MAQVRSKSPVGEYYLQGVMETASGFKLNADSSFAFFFSYGALDREGSGTWKTDGDSVIFNSAQKDGSQFSLLKAAKQDGEGITIKMEGASAHIKSLVHAVIKNKDQEEQASADEKGIIHLKMNEADTIILLFEWCPEKKFVFTPSHNNDNYYEFRFEPSMMDVLFHNFALKLTATGFTGTHPLDPAKSFTYKKAGSDTDQLR